MKPPKIISAQVIGDRYLLIEFSQGEFKKYDISSLLNKPMFTPLQNASFFKNFKIESGGYGLVWNEDIYISEYELWKNGVVDMIAKTKTDKHAIVDLILCDWKQII